MICTSTHVKIQLQMDTNPSVDNREHTDGNF